VRPAGTLYGFLPILNALEGAWMGTSQDLSLTQAGKGGEAIFRMDEREERWKMYATTCMHMKRYLYGIAGDGGLVGGGYTQFGGPSSVLG
jgi:hypothetical protein